MQEGRELLKAALARDDPTERKLAVVGVIDLALRDLGIRPVVVGGVAGPGGDRGSRRAPGDRWLRRELRAPRPLARAAAGATLTRMRKVTLQEWRAARAEGRARARRLAAGCPQPYVRERPRDPEEARLLRERGTPERLIGRTPEPREDDR